jgi:hypothetical protein
MAVKNTRPPLGLTKKFKTFCASWNKSHKVQLTSQGTNPSADAEFISIKKINIPINKIGEIFRILYKL